MRKKWTKARITDEMAQEIGTLVHTGLRKWTDDPESGTAWKAITEMKDGAWRDLMWIVADMMYTPARKAFREQLKEEGYKKL